MFFRNLTSFSLKPGLVLEELRDQLAGGQFKPCAPSEPMSRGWVSPRNDGSLVYALNQQWLVALTVEQRLLPAAVINQTVRERAEALAEENGYKPGRKQLRELKERVIAELLPKAFTKRTTTYAWIDPINRYLVINSASASQVDAVIEHLRQSLDTFPISHIQTEQSPVSAMTNWLAGGEAPAGFTIDRDCELKSVSEEKAAVRYMRHSLEGEDIKEHIVAGKLPSHLALTWNDRISFVLSAHMQLKRIAFLDLVLQEQEQEAGNAEEQFDVDFTLMTGELSRLLPALIAALGGEVSTTE